MRPFNLLFPLCLAITSGCASPATDCQTVISEFLDSPSPDTSRTLSGANASGCWNELAGEDSQFERLLGATTRGNEAAAAYLAAHLESTDGGMAKDALIALGSYADSDPDGLMRFVGENKLSEVGAISSIISVPLDLADRFDEQIDLLSARRVSLDKGTGHEALRTRLIQELDSAISERRVAAEATSVALDKN